MSPAPPPRGPQPPRRDEPEHPAERGAVPGGARGPAGKPGPAGKGPAPRGGPAPAPAAAKSPVSRAGRHFEVRKGRSENSADEQEEEGGPVNEIALPRSITQEQEEADLKRRLNREEVVDIDKRHAAVKMVGVAGGPAPSSRRGTGIWLLLLVVVAVVGLFLADKYGLLKGTGPKQPGPQATNAPK